MRADTSARPIRVLALTPYPIQAACVRFRILQFQEPLSRRGIELINVPFLDPVGLSHLDSGQRRLVVAGSMLASALKQAIAVLSLRNIDAVVVYREAMLAGPPLVESIATLCHGCPLVLDIDDAIYVSDSRPGGGLLRRIVRSQPGKTHALIKRSSLVICGNPILADYVSGFDKPSVVIPTLVDSSRWVPETREYRPDEIPVLGWIGSPSTYPYLEALFPALQSLARKHRFRLLVIGSGLRALILPGVDVEVADWSLDREVADFQSLDIGLYPVTPSRWAEGKSGFKAIQYMAVGIPYVASPVGVLATMGQPGTTHLKAGTLDEWGQALDRLLGDADLRRRMGAAGRAYSLHNYSIETAAGLLANSLKSVIRGR